MTPRICIVLTGTLLLFVACSQPPSTEPPEIAPPGKTRADSETTEQPSSDAQKVVTSDLLPMEREPTPAERLQALEARLLASDEFSFDHEITSTGNFTAEVMGRTEFRAGLSFELTSQGSFGGEAVDLRLASDGSVLDILGSKGARQIPAPAATPEALVLGLTRMGLLHNIALLIGSSPPDHAEGGVNSWVVAKDVESGETKMIGSRLAQALTFSIVVSGTPTAKATLWLALDDGLPVERHQTVHFAGGDMVVVERYRFRLVP